MKRANRRRFIAILLEKCELYGFTLKEIKDTVRWYEKRDEDFRTRRYGW
jgi:hypothetical protein